MLKIKSIRAQLFPVFLLISIISILTLTWFTTKSYRKFHNEELKTSLINHAKSLAPFISEELMKGNREVLDKKIKNSQKNSDIRITLIERDGTVISDSERFPDDMENHRDRSEIIDAINVGVGFSKRLSSTTGKGMFYTAISPINNDGVILRLSLPISFIKEANQTFSKNILFSVFIILILTALSTNIFVKKISAPLEEIRQGAEKFSKGDLSSPLLLEKPTKETQSLVNTLNKMAAELSEKISTISYEGQQSEAILSSMTEGVIAVDTDEKINKINHAALTMFHLESMETTKGRQLLETIRISTIYEIFKKTFNSNINIDTDIEITTASGEKKIIKTLSSPWVNKENNKLGVIFVFEDITRLTRLENLRRDFVANVSHELKTPVTSIKGYVETLIDGACEDTETLNSFLGTIAKQTSRLNSIIEDLLTLSRLEQNAIGQELAFEDFSINSIIKSAMEALTLTAHKKEIKLNTKLDEDCLVNVNPTLIEQAFVNLIDNAIKYSPENTEVTIRSKKSAATVDIQIIDQGMGIAKKHLPRLFERFYRIDKARSRKQGGTGLGLSIVKHIINMHDGSVSVSSFPGKGSTFTVYLPKASHSSLHNS